MAEAQAYPAEIAAAISAIMAEVDYVQKKGENKFHNYKFAAVGDILAKLQPAMAKSGLIIIQNELSHTLEGGVMMAKYEYVILHKSGVVAPDRPVNTGVAAAVNSKGGFDDKCLNKCMTAASKYFLLNLFKIPTGEDADVDAEEDKSDTKPPTKPSPPPAAATKSNGFAAPQLVDPDTGEVKHFDKASDFLQALKAKMETGNAVNWWAVNGAAALHIANRAPDKAGEFVRKLQTMATEKDAA